MRLIAPLFLLALTLASCFPTAGSFTPSDPSDVADPCDGIDADADGSFVYLSGCDEQPPLDCDDTDPLLRAEEGCYHGNGDLIPSCFDGATWLAILVDSNGDTHNDEVAERTLAFSDGSTRYTNYGMVWVPYTGQTVEFMAESLSNEQLFVFTQVFVYNDTSVLLGELVPRLNAPWVAFDCPSD